MIEKRKKGARQKRKSIRRYFTTKIENKKVQIMLKALVERGIKNYKKLAVVFKGKHVTIKEGDG